MKKKKVPLRKCLGCGENKSKKELLRIVKNSDDSVIIDNTGKINGRGAYICRNDKCFEKAMKGKKIDKALKCEIPTEIYEQLKKEIDKYYE